jgi:hypothetical protein
MHLIRGFLFIIFIYLLNRLSKNYDNFQDFNTYDKNKLSDLINLEKERCKTMNVCGYVNGKQIPCKFKSCEDTCVCKGVD